jgi:hypothetical protein
MGTENKVDVEVGLATYRDQEEQIETYPIVDVPPNKVGNPFPTQTPKAILERWYQVYQMNFSQTQAAGENSIHCGNLFLERAIYNCLRTFKFLKFSAIEFKIQYSTVPTVYGWLIATCLPKALFSTLDYLPVLASHTDSVILDLSCQQDVTISAPWISPEQWIDLTDYYQGSGGILISVQSAFVLRVYNSANPVKVLDSTAINTIKLQVFMRFCDAEVAGHIDDLEPPKPVGFFSQSKGFFGAGAQRLQDVFGQQTYGIPQRGTNPNDEFRDVILDHIRSTSTNNQPKTAVSPSSDPDEPELKPNVYGSLVCSAPKYVLGTGNQSTGSRDWRINDILALPTLIGEGELSFSLSVPTILARAQPEEIYSRISYMSQMFRMWRGTFNYTLIIFSSPFVTARLNLAIVYEGDQLLSVNTVGNKIIQDVTVRGTTRVDFQVPYLFGTQWQPTYWQGAGSVGYPQGPQIYSQMISAPEGNGDLTPVLPYLLYESAHSDFRFRSLINPFPVLSEDTFVSQMRVSDLHRVSKLFNGVTESLGYLDDTESTISQMLNRWSNSVPGFYSLPVNTNADSAGVFSIVCQLFGFYSGQIKHKMLVASEDTADPFDQIIVVMDNLIEVVVSPSYGIPLRQRVEDGMTIISNQVSQVFEFVAPFLANCSFLPCSSEENNLVFSRGRLIWKPNLFITGVDIPVVPTWSMVAAGPDFSLYYPIPPGTVTSWPSYGHLAKVKVTRKKSSNFTKMDSCTETSTEEFTAV